jgi:hypothetical protein
VLYQNMARSSDFVRLMLMAKLSVDEEDGNLTALAFRPGSQQQQLIHRASAPQAHPDEAS